MRVFGKDFADLTRYRLVDLEARLDEDQVGTPPFGRDRWHRRPNTKFSRLVARRCDHTAFARTPDGHRLTPQLGIVPLFDRRVECVHIDVNDLTLPRGLGCGFARPRFVAVRSPVRVLRHHDRQTVSPPSSSLPPRATIPRAPLARLMRSFMARANFGMDCWPW